MAMEGLQFAISIGHVKPQGFSTFRQSLQYVGYFGRSVVALHRVAVLQLGLLTNLHSVCASVGEEVGT